MQYMRDADSHTEPELVALRDLTVRLLLTYGLMIYTALLALLATHALNIRNRWRLHSSKSIRHYTT